MQLKKYVMCTLSCSLIVMALTGCSANKSTDNANLKELERLGNITVCSREEGSGTRAVFAETIGFGDSSTGEDFTREDCVILDGNDAVMEAVGMDSAAIGYVSGGSLGDNNDIHAIEIDGEALTRVFYLTYSGKLSELEQDFLTYVQGAGQEIVGKNYETVKKTTTFLSGKPGGTIKIGGSSSVSGLMEELAEEYMSINPNAVIDITTTDTKDGLNGAMEGSYDFGMSSRELADYEKELLTYVPIAKDTIAVIVNNENPIENISSSQLKDIYTGKITEWRQLN